MVPNVGDKIACLYEQLQDQESKNVLIDILRFLSDSSKKYLVRSNYPQYRHPHIEFSYPFKMIDGGACRGEVFGQFSDLMKPENQFLLLEPEIENLSYIEIEKSKSEANIQILPLGLWSSKKSLFFSSPQQSGAHYNCMVSDQGDIEIKVIDLDQLCIEQNFEPNFIKMDIEGAEVEALKSSVNTIRALSPKLAICLYHDLDDLWNIPKFINDINPNYKMYMGHHSDSWFETVLYCK